jgi:hypothetical protein
VSGLQQRLARLHGTRIPPQGESPTDSRAAGKRYLNVGGASTALAQTGGTDDKPIARCLPRA